MAKLSRELHYFIDNQDELVELYEGRVLALKGERVIGVFDSVFEAVEETSREHELGTFAVQRCEAGPECYTIYLRGRIT